MKWPQIKTIVLMVGCLVTFIISFAKPLSIKVNPFQYDGEYKDQESFLLYLKARYLDPNLGIAYFITPDYGKVREQKNLFDGNYNTFADNPIMNQDPSGHTAIDTATIVGYSLINVAKNLPFLDNDIGALVSIQTKSKGFYVADMVTAIAPLASLWSTSNIESGKGLLGNIKRKKDLEEQLQPAFIFSQLTFTVQFLYTSNYLSSLAAYAAITAFNISGYSGAGKGDTSQLLTLQTGMNTIASLILSRNYLDLQATEIEQTEGQLLNNTRRRLNILQARQERDLQQLNARMFGEIEAPEEEARQIGIRMQQRQLHIDSIERRITRRNGIRTFNTFLNNYWRAR